jgi:hypothetical protein
MAMIAPKSQDERRVEESQFPTGMYLVKLAEVREVGPSAKFPNGNHRLVFDFEVADGPYKGKRSAMFVGKSLFRDSKSNKESNLVKLARSMGVVKPEEGFDPDLLVGKFFNAMCEQDASSPDGRTWVRAVTPAGAPAGQPTAPPAPGTKPPPPPPKKPAAAPVPEPADDSKWQLYDDHAGEYLPKTGKEVRAWFYEKKIAPDAVHVCPEGSDVVKPADEYGFSWVPF